MAETKGDYHLLTPAQAAKRIKELETEMYRHAKDLEFEQAASARDELTKLKAEFFGNEPLSETAQSE